MNTSAQTAPRLDALDHVVIAVRDLDTAAGDYARLFGRAASWRGTHPGQGTANALFRFDNTYVELLAAVGAGGLADALRARLQEGGEGLVALAFATADVAALARSWRHRGIEVGEARPGRGRDAASGAERSWRSLPLPDAVSRGVVLFAIEHDAPSAALPVAAPTCAPDTVLESVDHVVVFSGDAAASRRVYGDLLGLRLALDRTFAERGLRLLFFRVGGLTVEMSASLTATPDPGRDSLWGIAYRCADVAAARRRLRDAGFDVSEVRAGHKPGTRVCTVRAPTHGVATLLIAADAA